MKKRKVRSGLTAVVLIAVILVSLILPGCGLIRRAVTGIDFTFSEYDMIIGETKKITLASVEVTPASASDKTFYLRTADPAIVAIENDSVTMRAVGEGTVEVYVVSNYSDNISGSCTVTVGYAEIETLSIATSGELIQQSANPSKIEFRAQFNANVDPTETVDWYINDELKQEDSLQFSFTPATAAGEYEIKAVYERDGADDLSDTAALRVYSAFETAPTASCTSGSLNQEDDNLTAVNFTSDFSPIAGDPDPSVRWMVNGEVAATTKNFSFTPKKAGEYNITLNINAVNVTFDTASDVVSVRVTGSIVPENVGFDFDNAFPSLIVSWDDPEIDGMGWSVAIKPSGGPETVYSSDAHSDRFDGVSFDVKGIIDVTKSYSVRVRSEGDGGLYIPSQFSTAINTEALSESAAAFLVRKGLGGAVNYYACDDDDFCAIVAADMISRGNASTVTSRIYMGYTSAFSARDLAFRAFDLAHLTGSCTISASGTAAKYKTVTVTINFDTVNVPTLETGFDKKGNADNAGLNAARPHVNTDETKYRTSDYKFKIESRPVSAAVSHTEQLYYAAEKGYNPVPQNGSKADELYTYAKNTLRRIVTDDMSDADKVHAIYDWVMWRVSYDHYVTTISDLKSSVKYKAYYLDGVLTDTTHLAVCDGMTKAMVLMCNIEGIECIRVAGVAYSSGDWGGHAWNKVKLGENWYIVDCTWGDYTGMLGTAKYEMAGHSYLFLTDAEVVGTHREDTPNKYPATATTPYNWYANPGLAGGGEVDFYIETAGQALRDELTALFTFSLSSRPSSRSFTVGYWGNATQKTLNTTSSDYFALEFAVSPAAKAQVQTLIKEDSMLIKSVFAATGYKGTYRTVTDGMIFTILFKI